MLFFYKSVGQKTAEERILKHQHISIETFTIEIRRDNIMGGEGHRLSNNCRIILNSIKWNSWNTTRKRKGMEQKKYLNYDWDYCKINDRHQSHRSKKLREYQKAYHIQTHGKRNKNKDKDNILEKAGTGVWLSYLLRSKCNNYLKCS